MAIDEHYAGPLFVTVTSLLENLRAGVGLELHLMDGDLTPATRRKLEGAWDDRVRLHWVSLDHDKLEVLRATVVGRHSSRIFACWLDPAFRDPSRR